MSLSVSSTSSASSAIATSKASSESGGKLPSQIFPKHIVEALGGMKAFNQLPFLKLAPMRLTVGWCPKHQRNFTFNTRLWKSEDENSKGKQLAGPIELSSKNIPAPIVIGMIGENPFLALKVTAFSVTSFTRSTKVSSSKKENDQVEIQKLETDGTYAEGVVGLVWNPCVLDDCYQSLKPNFCKRALDEYENRFWSWRCKSLDNKTRAAILKRYPDGKNQADGVNCFSYFGDIDTHLGSLVPFNSIKNFSTQFLSRRESFVFANWRMFRSQQIERVIDEAGSWGHDEIVTKLQIKGPLMREIPRRDSNQNVILTLSHKVPTTALVSAAWLDYNGEEHSGFSMKWDQNGHLTIKNYPPFSEEPDEDHPIKSVSVKRAGQSCFAGCLQWLGSLLWWS